MSIVYLPHLGASVALQSGSLGGNTSGASTFFGSNVVLAGGSNVTLQASSDTIYVHGASAATGGGGAGTAWAITGGSITVNTSGGTISLPAYLTTAAPPGAYLTTAAQSDHSHGALSLVNLTGTSSSNGLTLSAAAPGGGAAIMVSAGTTSGNVQTLRFQDSNGVSFGLNGSTVTGSHNGYTGATTQWLTTAQPPGAYLTTAAQSDHSHGSLALTNLTGTSASNGLSLSAAGSSLPRLDQVLDLNTDKVFNMGLSALQFQYAGGGSFSTNATRQGLFEIDVIGNITGGADVVHIHQSVANPVIDLLHLEAAGTGVTPLHIVAGGNTGMEINAPIYFSGGSVPMVLGTSQSNVVSNLNAFYHEGTRVSDLAARTHSHGNPTLALTNITGTTASASNGLTLSLSGNAAQTVQPAVGLNTAQTNVTWTVNTSGISLNAGGYAGTGTSATNATFTLNSNGLALSVAAPGAGGGLGTNTAGTNITWTANTSGLSINAAGYAGTGTSATNASVTLNSNGLAISVAAPGGGAAATLSRWDPCSYVTGSSYSSHAPATWFFQHLENDEARAISYVDVVKSFGAGVPAGTSSNVSQTFRLSYSHGFTIFSRQNYGAQSTNLTTVATASWGMSVSFQHSSSNSQSLDLRWVTNSTGGTDQYATNSAGNGWSARMVGPRLVRIPWVTTLPAGEYWIAHNHSTTAASTGATATTIAQVSNFHIVPQLLNSNLQLMGAGGTSSSVGHLWPAAQGVANAVTTNNTMAMSAISNLTAQLWYWNAGNI